MFSLLISASNATEPAFGIRNTQRTVELMKQFSFNKQHNTSLCVSIFNGKQELSVRVDNCQFAVPHIKAILQMFQQQCCMVMWENAGIAELLYVDGRSVRVHMDAPVALDWVDDSTIDLQRNILLKGTV